jgi:hypothetical protein
MCTDTAILKWEEAQEMATGGFSIVTEMCVCF